MQDPHTIRLLECWIPLAQELSEAQGWGEDAAGLEALIRLAGPALQHVSSLEGARLVLTLCHTLMHRERGVE